MIALYFYNEFFIQTIDMSLKKETDQKPPFDVKIQTLIAKYMTKFVFPAVTDSNFLEDNTASDKDKHVLNIKFVLLDEHLTKLTELQGKKLETKQMKGIYFEMCYSFLKLLNKSSMRFFLGSTFKSFSG